MIEILTVVGILAILMLIGVLGYRSIAASASKKATMVTLANADGMLAELRASGAFVRLEADKVMTDPKPLFSSDGSDKKPTIKVSDIDSDDAKKLQLRVLKLLRTIPKSKTALENLPAPALLPAKTVLSTAANDDPPFLADGWGNRIIFVPSGGLEGVETAGGTGIVSSTTVRKTTDPSTTGDLPFWASAGPDGDFENKASKEDDNLYSFQK